MLNLYRRAADFINFMLTVTLAIGCIELLCVHSALKDVGIVIGHPTSVVYIVRDKEDSFEGAYREAARDPRLTQLAAAVDSTPARRSH